MSKKNARKKISHKTISSPRHYERIRFLLIKYGRYIWSFLIGCGRLINLIYKYKLMALILITILLVHISPRLYKNLIINTIVKSLENNEKYHIGLAPYTKFIDRPAEYNNIKENIKSQSIYFYLIVGEKGIGKTSLIRKISNDNKGITYFDLTSVTSTNKFTDKIKRVLNIHDKNPWFSLYEWLLSISINSDILTLDSVFRYLEMAAITYKKKHGYRVIIAIDDINKISDEEILLEKILEHGKKWAYDDLITLVLIASYHPVLEKMKKISASSRMTIIELTNLPEEDSIEYLKQNNKNIKNPLVIKEAVKEIGGRFIDLIYVINSVDENDFEKKIKSLKKKHQSYFDIEISSK